ncbi:hypothetical protein PIB30_054667 [Stylosanthes scabra]|uniref:Uncharacterized protein n=1 Tax=Stylosanthes scabra TaxID=79078 RepID=A0ABU6RJ12_9FABA|nr:hypothetical protein [Stylosanthes scabra]
MRPMQMDLFGEMDEQVSTIAMDVDDVDPLEIFPEGVISADNKLADADFFNNFQDDFNDVELILYDFGHGLTGLTRESATEAAMRLGLFKALWKRLQSQPARCSCLHSNGRHASSLMFKNTFESLGLGCPLHSLLLCPCFALPLLASYSDAPEQADPTTEEEPSDRDQHNGPTQNVSPIPKRIRKPPTWLKDYHMGKTLTYSASLSLTLLHLDHCSLLYRAPPSL